jgi:hypothetical protein
LRTIAFAAAPQLNCLASPLIITPWPVIRNGHRNAARLKRFRTPIGCRRLVSGSCQTSSEALVSFHSRYYCAIGLGAYLRLEADASQFHARFPTHATQDPRHCHAKFSPTGLSPSLVEVFLLIRVTCRGRPWSYNSTSPFAFAGDSDCRIPFSIAFTYGISIDFFSSPY